MKRRDLLKSGVAALAGAVTGCDRNGDSKSLASRSATAPTPTPPAQKQDEVEVAVVQPQMEPCPFAFAGERIGHIRGKNVVVYHLDRNSSQWSVELSLELDRPHGIGVLADGSLGVLEDTSRPQIVILAPDKTTSVSFTGSVGTNHRRRSRMFAGERADMVVVASYDSRETVVDRLVLANGTFSREARLTLLPDDFNTLAVLADGSLIHASPRNSSLSRVRFGGREDLYALDESTQLVNHVVAGPNDRTAWMSNARGGLLLLTLGEPASVAARAPDAVHHLARAGTRAVALVIEQSAGRVTSASVVVFDGEAKESWRAPVASMRNDSHEPHWVAGSDKYVAVGTTNALEVFNAGDGKKMTIQTR